MKRLICIITILVINAMPPIAKTPIAFSPLNLLSEEQFKDLENGKMVIVKEKLKDYVWPRLHVFSYVKSTPLNAMGIFAAYDHQKNYVPNVIKSNVVEVKSATNILVEYELKMPWPLDNGVYTHGHHLNKSEQGYKLDWYLVKSNSADHVEGYAIFRNWGKKTLMYYNSLVDPKSIFGGVLKKLMVKDVEKTLKAIIKEIEVVDQSKPELKQKYSDKITKALQGKKPY
ncbi:MAG: hypothetical protein GY909_08705 [Oligoflexia bacterium]|nr:hypothetical protein [Oligoflexia bacterium]